MNVNRSTVALASVELFKSYPDSLLQFFFVCCVILTIFGIPGNLVTITALASCRKFRNGTAILIINLHISNLMYCSFILPVMAASYSEKQWAFGMTACRVFAFVKFSLTGTAHFTVLAITINRYIMVCHPFNYPSFHKKSILIMSLLSTWILGFGIFLPTFFEIWGRFDLQALAGICSMVPDKNNHNPNQFFTSIAFTGLFLIMCLCYGRIWWIIRKNTQRRNKATKAQNITLATASDGSSVSDRHTGQLPLVRVSSSEDENLQIQNDSVILSPFRKTIVKPLAILTTINKRNGPRFPTRKDKKLASMILALLISFTLCHLPLLITKAVHRDDKSHPVANVIAHLFEYSSVCITPIMYVIISNEYRHVYKRLFRKVKTNIIKRFIC